MDKEKEARAIKILQIFAPLAGESYYLCYSGGKDSDAIRILAGLAGVPHEIHHNLTSVDAPETVKYIQSIPDVIIEKARYPNGQRKTMWNLIPKKKLPPTRLMRWCCSELKEWGGKGRTKITGVRYLESASRKQNQGLITILEKPQKTQQLLEKLGLDFRVNPKGGIVMEYDNDIVQDDIVKFQMCFAGRTKTVNPIVDWTDQDVWEFLHYYGCEGNPLYQCRFKRVGCIGCPMAGKKQKSEFQRYPKFKALYINAFDRMLTARKESGLENKVNWQTGEDVFRWWIGEDIDQYTMFDETEIYSIMSGMKY